jgi:hypothetical protein
MLAGQTKAARGRLSSSNSNSRIIDAPATRALIFVARIAANTALSLAVGIIETYELMRSRTMRVTSAFLPLQFARFRKQFVDHIHLFPGKLGTSEMAVCCGVQVDRPAKLQMVDHSLRGQWKHLPD